MENRLLKPDSNIVLLKGIGQFADNSLDNQL